jgi:hypothetical protein
VRWRRPAIRAILAVVGGAAGFMIGSLIGPPFDVIFVPFGAFAGYKTAPRRRRTRS